MFAFYVTLKAERKKKHNTTHLHHTNLKYVRTNSQMHTFLFRSQCNAWYDVNAIDLTVELVAVSRFRTSLERQTS